MVAVAKASALFKASHGCEAMALERSIETPNSFNLRITWATVDDHMIGFRQSPAFAEWRALVSEFFANSPVVEHCEAVGAYF